MSFAISVCFGYRLSISISIGLGHLHSILVRCLAIPLGHRTKQPEFYAFFINNYLQFGNSVRNQNSMKCPICNSSNCETIHKKNYSGGEKAAALGGAIALTAIGTFVAGPIGAIAGGFLGKAASQGLQNVAGDKGVIIHKCKTCGHQWKD